jgi:hypothetical protein
MAIKDPIKEIFEEFNEGILSYRNEREEAIANFKNVVQQKIIEDIKEELKTDVTTGQKK